MEAGHRHPPDILASFFGSGSAFVPRALSGGRCSCLTCGESTVFGRLPLVPTRLIFILAPLLMGS